MTLLLSSSLSICTLFAVDTAPLAAHAAPDLLSHLGFASYAAMLGFTATVVAGVASLGPVHRHPTRSHRHSTLTLSHRHLTLTLTLTLTATQPDRTATSASLGLIHRHS